MGKKTLCSEKKVVIKSLVDAGQSYRQVQKIIPISLGYITRIIKEFESDRELIEWYRKNRADILLKAQIDSMALQEAIRQSITEDDINSWTPDQKARWHHALTVDHGVKFDKERVEKGESTENVAVIHEFIIKMKKEDRKKQQQEKEEQARENRLKQSE